MLSLLPFRHIPKEMLFSEVLNEIPGFTVESLNNKWDENDKAGMKNDILKENIKKRLLKNGCSNENWNFLDEIAFIENSSMKKYIFESDISQLCNAFEYSAETVLIFLDEGFFTVADKRKYKGEQQIIRCREGDTIYVDSDEIYAVSCKRYIKVKMNNKWNIKENTQH